jgi:MFS superfamily sulfate permease-like transporter
MTHWKLYYLLGAALWLVLNLRKVASFVTDGALTFTPPPTGLRLVAIAIAMFWSYVCGAALWPGSLVVWALVTLLQRTAGPDDEEF